MFAFDHKYISCVPTVFQVPICQLIFRIPCILKIKWIALFIAPIMSLMPLFCSRESTPNTLCRKAAELSLEYQKHLIKSLAQSERAMSKKYANMQRALEFEDTHSGFYTMVNTSALRMSNTHPKRNRSLKENKDDTVARGFSVGSEPDEPSVGIESVPPPVKPRTLIGELLLCFQLLNDSLGYHIAVSKLSDLAALNYDNLQAVLRRIHDSELRKLEAEHADTPNHVKAEAMKNIQMRLDELARAGSLMKRLVEKDDNWPEKPRTDSSISRPPTVSFIAALYL